MSKTENESEPALTAKTWSSATTIEELPRSGSGWLSDGSRGAAHMCFEGRGIVD